MVSFRSESDPADIYVRSQFHTNDESMLQDATLLRRMILEAPKKAKQMPSATFRIRYASRCF